MVSMVLSGIDVRHICTITFTKAAAREFYSRFQDKLAKIMTDTNDDKVRSLCTEALQNIDLCFMGTIDSFSELILREHRPKQRYHPTSQFVPKVIWELYIAVSIRTSSEKCTAKNCRKNMLYSADFRKSLKRYL